MRSLEDLVPSLVEATNDSRLQWSHAGGMFGSEAYWVPLGKHSIVAFTWSTDDEARTGYTVSLLTGNAPPKYPLDVLDTVFDDEFGPKFTLVKDLYSTARRSALKIDDIVDELEDVLEALPMAVKVPQA